MEPALYIEKDGLFSVECRGNDSPNCCKHGEFCDSEEDALDWVESECWISSGDGWICLQCHAHYMNNLYRVRVDKSTSKKKAEEKKKDDDDGTELFKGIETVL